MKGSETMSLVAHRGVHLPNLKEPAMSSPVTELSVAELQRVVVPLSYTEANPQPAVQEYEMVLQGKLLAAPPSAGRLTADHVPVHAPVSGVVAGFRTVQHPLYRTLSCVAIDCLGAEEPVVSEPDDREKVRPVKRKAEKILDSARQAGIVDEIDGYPLAAKLQEWRDIGCDLLVADGAQNQPYASSAWAVLNQWGQEVWAGLQLAAAAIAGKGNPKPQPYIAIYATRSQQKQLLSALPDLPAEAIYPVRRRYPAARYARHARGKRVCRIGVQACLALYQAVAFGQPHTHVVVTVAGDAVARPQNVRVPFGASARQLLQHCGLTGEVSAVILGDMMTGVTAASDKVLILPGVTCLLAMKELGKPPAHEVCIGCGRCARVCHVGLLPYEITRRVENMQYEHLPGLHATLCDGCGACSFVCPAGREVAAQVQQAAEVGDTIYLNWEDDKDA